MEQANEVLRKIQILKDTPSTNAKVDKLKEFLEDEVFSEVVLLTYDETMHYNIIDIPPAKKLHHPPKDRVIGLADVIKYLRFLSKRKGATNEEKQDLGNLCTDANIREVAELICNKDLKCGIASGLINKARPDMIRTIPYMRCQKSSYLDRIIFPATVQNKEDGVFAYIIRDKEETSYISRTGNRFLLERSKLHDSVFRTFPKGFVYMGELRAVDYYGQFLPRKESNGLVNKTLDKNNTATQQNRDDIKFICWDTVPIEAFYLGYCKYPYNTRLKWLEFLSNNRINNCSFVKNKLVNSIEEAQVFAQEQIALKEEGAVLKNLSGLWKKGTSSDCIKLKSGDLGITKERECELRITGWVYGKAKTKYHDCLGSLICESEDKKLEVNVGTGLSDFQRKLPAIELDNMFVGKIITVRFNEVIQDKKGSKYRLFLPRFIELRHDKTTADTLEYIKEL